MGSLTVHVAEYDIMYRIIDLFDVCRISYHAEVFG